MNVKKPSQTLKIREIKSGHKRLKKIYVAIVMFLFGRAFQAASHDRDVKKEYAYLPDNFVLDLCVEPSGPHMLVGKNKKGRMKYLGWNPKGKKVTLAMRVKNLEAAMLMFTFRESTCGANSHNRIIVDGDIKDALSVVRTMNLLEVYLLPMCVARFGVKRYPLWSQMSPVRKHLGRVVLYLRLITG